MEFNEQLNTYIELLQCTAKELSDVSGLSPSVISRYRTGEREPDVESDNLIKLAQGIATIALSRQQPDLSYDAIYSALQNAFLEKNTFYEQFASNYDTLIKTLEIPMKELAAATNFDSSYLYRIRSGQRHPKDLHSFSDSFCDYITSHYQNPSDKEKLVGLFGCTMDNLNEPESYRSQLTAWLLHTPAETSDHYMDDFLEKLNEFDLDEYIRTIHFDELKVPSSFQIPGSRHYYGAEDSRKGELDFFKATVLSSSTEPVFMCSDMPMINTSGDKDFNKKRMFVIAMSQKKGLHINIIHNVDRPFEELIQGLETWIPIYMTGQVSPYHLPHTSTNIYHHLNYVSGSLAFTGESIPGHPDKAKYYLTNNKEELSYYKQKADFLLEKAEPLIEIYTKNQKVAFETLANTYIQKRGKRHHLLSALPLYTISTELLIRILNRNHISQPEQKELLYHVEKEHFYAKTILQNNVICDEIPHLSAKEFIKHPMKLFVAGAFLDKEITYTYEDYIEHLRLTKDYARKHPNYTCKKTKQHTFPNIQIYITENDNVLISKAQSPTIHFVIRHPKIVQALQNFVPNVACR